MLSSENDTTSGSQQISSDKRHAFADLLEAIHRMISTLDLPALLEVILDEARGVVDYVGAAIVLRSRDELSTQICRGPMTEQGFAGTRVALQDAPISQLVIATQQPLVIPDVFDDTPLAVAFRRSAGNRLYGALDSMRCWMGIPMVLRGESVGLIAFGHSDPAHFSPHHGAALAPIANEAAIAIEHAQLYTQAHGLATELERQRMARELHDSVAQSLYSVVLYAESVRRMLVDGRSEQALDAVGVLKATALDALGEMRLIIHELRPPRLEELGLGGALRARLSTVEERAGVHGDLQVVEPLTLSMHQQQELFRLASEALNNVTKHARAKEVRVRLAQRGEVVHLEIIDDGVGFDVNAMPAGLGLQVMRERTAALSGEYEISSSPGKGTRVSFSIPAETGGILS